MQDRLLKLYLSNRLENLAAALTAQAQAQVDLQSPVQVVVQDLASRRFLELQWARQCGILMGVNISFWADWADGFDVQRLRESIVDDLTSAQDLPGEVSRYLMRGSERGKARRRFQLARELAHAFYHYYAYRPQWLRKGALKEDVLGELAWQAQLWQANVNDHIIQEPSSLDKDIYVFYRPFWLPSEVRRLLAFAEKVDVHLFHFSPSSHYWEDQKQGLLAEWGKRLAVSNRLLYEAVNFDFVQLFGQPPEDTTLDQLQTKMFEAQIEIGDNIESSDHDASTLEFWQAASARRELETTADMIWQLVADNDDLDLRDVAVCFPQKVAERYASLVGQVFAESGNLPFHVVDTPSHVGHNFLAAFRRMIDLPLSEFERPDVLGVISSDAVAATQVNADPAQWSAWCEELGIFHGFDFRDHAGTYIEDNRYNWLQGMQRLALGAFMERVQGADDVLTIGKETFVPLELSTSQLAAAGGFIRLVGGLLRDCRRARRSRLPRRKWKQFFERLLRTYMRPTADSDDRDLQRCLRALEFLDYESDVELEYAVVHEALAEALTRAIAGTTGDYLVSGVTVGPLHSGRSFPKKVCFLLGLGEVNFPSERRISGLDARRFSPMPHDVSSLDQDLTAMLEALSSARLALYVSYVARDEESGEATSPSVVYRQLKAYTPRYNVRRIAMDSRGQTGPLCAIPAREQRQAKGRSSIAPIRPAENIHLSLSSIRRFLESPLQGWSSHVLGVPEVELENVDDRRDEEFEIQRGRFILLETITTFLTQGTNAYEVYDEMVATLERTGRVPTGPLLEMEKHRHHALLRQWLDQLESQLPNWPPHGRLIHVGKPSVALKADMVLPPLEIETPDGLTALEGTLLPEDPRLGTLLFSTGSRINPRHRLRGALDAVVRLACGLEMPGRFTIVSPEQSKAFELKSVSRQRAQQYLAYVVEDLLQEEHQYLMPCEPTLQWLAKPKGAMAEEIERSFEGWNVPSCQYGPIADWTRFPIQDDESIAQERLGIVLDITKEVP